MNYKKIYDSLITKAKNRETLEYTEKHHVLPRCMGGSDEHSNLVRLTAREHYIAHWLLAKAYRSRKLVFAWRSMAMDPLGKRYTSHSFKYAREAWIKEMANANSGICFSEERKRNLSLSHIGQQPWNKGVKMPTHQKYIDARDKYYAEPVKCKMCENPIPYRMRTRKNRTYCSRKCYFSDPDISQVRIGKPGKVNSGSFKPGNKISEETANRISDKLTGMKRPRGVCPHCGKEGAVSLLKRWHFDNCKELKC